MISSTGSTFSSMLSLLVLKYALADDHHARTFSGVGTHPWPNKASPASKAMSPMIISSILCVVFSVKQRPHHGEQVLAVVELSLSVSKRCPMSRLWQMDR